MTTSRKLNPWEAIRAVMEFPRLRPLDRLLVVLLLKHEGQRGCFPSDALLAREAGCSRKPIVAARMRLRDAGLLVWRHGADTNRYQVNLDVLLQGLHSVESTHSDGSDSVESTHSDGSDSVESTQALCRIDTPDSVESTHKRTNERTKERTKKDGVSVRALLDHFYNETVRIRGVKPVIEGAKDSATFRRLLSGRSLDEARWIVTEYLQTPPDWQAKQDMYEPEHIVQAANKILNRRTKRARRAADGNLDPELEAAIASGRVELS